MQFSDDCRSHALVLIEIANESPKFKEQALALAESWLTLANIHNRFCSNPSYSRSPGTLVKWLSWVKWLSYTTGTCEKLSDHLQGRRRCKGSGIRACSSRATCRPPLRR